MLGIFSFSLSPLHIFTAIVVSHRHCSYCTPEGLLKGAETIKMEELFSGHVQRYFTTSPHKDNKSSFKLFIMPQRATSDLSLPHIDHTFSLNISCHA